MYMGTEFECRKSRLNVGDKFILNKNDKRVFVVRRITEGDAVVGDHDTTTIFNINGSYVIQVTDSDIDRMGLIERHAPIKQRKQAKKEDIINSQCGGYTDYGDLIDNLIDAEVNSEIINTYCEEPKEKKVTEIDG